MQAPRHRVLILALAVMMALATLDSASARQKKKSRTAPQATTSEQWLRSSLVPVDRHGTPIIMKGYQSPGMMRDESLKDVPTSEPRQRADRPVRVPRGSSTYIPPPDP